MKPSALTRPAVAGTVKPLPARLLAVSTGWSIQLALTWGLAALKQTLLREAPHLCASLSPTCTSASLP